MIKVFFDEKCNLCSKEINYYKKIAPKNIFSWQDVNSENNDLKNMGIKTSDALKYLHVLNNNKLYIGIDGFIVIWENLSYWKVLGKIISLPILKHITSLAYKLFANWRFNKLDHCLIAKQNDKTLNN